MKASELMQNQRISALENVVIKLQAHLGIDQPEPSPSAGERSEPLGDEDAPIREDGESEPHDLGTSDTSNGAAPSGEMEVFYADSVGAIHPFLSCTNLVRLFDAQERVAAADAECQRTHLRNVKLIADVNKLREELEEAQERARLDRKAFNTAFNDREKFRGEVSDLRGQLQALKRTPTPGVVSEEAWRAGQRAYMDMNPNWRITELEITAILTAAAPFMGQQRREISEEEWEMILTKARGSYRKIAAALGITITTTKPAAEGELRNQPGHRDPGAEP